MEVGLESGQAKQAIRHDEEKKKKRKDKHDIGLKKMRERQEDRKTDRQTHRQKTHRKIDSSRQEQIYTLIRKQIFLWNNERAR